MRRRDQTRSVRALAGSGVQMNRWSCHRLSAAAPRGDVAHGVIDEGTPSAALHSRVAVPAISRLRSRIFGALQGRNSKRSYTCGFDTRLGSRSAAAPADNPQPWSQLPVLGNLRLDAWRPTCTRYRIMLRSNSASVLVGASTRAHCSPP